MKDESVAGDTTKHERGKGTIPGPDIPIATAQDDAAGIEKSLGGMSRSDLKKGYRDMGSITSSTKSNPVDMNPGMNNKDA